MDGSSLLNDSVMKRSLAKVSGKTADEAMPNITTPDFCIYFERRWAYADTILLHVKANGVNIQNNYDDDLVLYGVDDELVLLIPRRRTAVLPFSQKVTPVVWKETDSHLIRKQLGLGYAYYSVRSQPPNCRLDTLRTSFCVLSTLSKSVSLPASSLQRILLFFLSSSLSPFA